MLDDWGESLAGLTDSVISGGEKFVHAWFENEADKVKSAAPEEQRPHYVPAQQPNGQPIVYKQTLPINTTHILLGVLVVGGIVYLAKRG
ncbi:hypothetical protein TUMSATVNIG1_16460 [Vibrio nigripulchritudo]|uniref:hypothetical protein n=1 Tax=Vibrio TaxID=662 RepID=UPI00190E1233|nr:MULTISPECIES: hypothetical protein [Vibrio]UAB68818.1 hypothetical protein INR79_09685 [Vibrio sp. SCSIO 43132]UAB72387.1 hypothetical protein INR79_24330 [Vibrio sp. SCSIO 43132]BCL69690.1 hypothetical protein VNTUMSATTG_16270 [Vibrio nigripulchritudo]BDU31037.1 hypothetical protein TUMSATVNIG1_16460 [Vibrio nigripulchritudo]